MFNNNEVIKEASIQYFHLIYKYWVCEASLQEMSEDLYAIDLDDFSDEFRSEYHEYMTIEKDVSILKITDGLNDAAAHFMELIKELKQEGAHSREAALQITFMDPSEFKGGLLEEWEIFLEDRREEEIEE